MADKVFSLHYSSPVLTAIKTRIDRVDLFKPVKNWISQISIRNPAQAHRLAGLIPAQCPFERDIVLWGRVIAHIPPMCKINPVYYELIELRFKALCYLADECGEDISAYV